MKYIGLTFFVLLVFGAGQGTAKSYYAWVNRPLVLEKDCNRISLSGYSVFGTSGGVKGGGLADTDLGFEPGGIVIRHGFGGTDLGVSYAAFFSTGRANIAPMASNWPDNLLSNKGYVGVFAVLMGVHLSDWAALRMDIVVPTRDFKTQGIATVISLPLRMVISPGLLETHLKTDLLFSMGGSSSGYKAISVRGGVGFSLLPEFLLQQDVVFTSDIDPTGNAQWSTVTGLGWQFSHGMDLLIRYTYKGIRTVKKAQYVSLGLGINF